MAIFVLQVAKKASALKRRKSRQKMEVGSGSGRPEVSTGNPVSNGSGNEFSETEEQMQQCLKETNSKQGKL